MLRSHLYCGNRLRFSAVTTAKGDRLEPYDDLAEVTTLLQALECRGNLVDPKVAANSRSDGMKLHRPHHGLERGAAAGRRDMHGGGAADQDAAPLVDDDWRGFGEDFSRASKSA